MGVKYLSPELLCLCVEPMTTWPRSSLWWWVIWPLVLLCAAARAVVSTSSQVVNATVAFIAVALL